MRFQVESLDERVVPATMALASTTQHAVFARFNPAVVQRMASQQAAFLNAGAAVNNRLVVSAANARATAALARAQTARLAAVTRAATAAQTRATAIANARAAQAARIAQVTTGVVSSTNLSGGTGTIFAGSPSFSGGTGFSGSPTFSPASSTFAGSPTFVGVNSPLATPTFIANPGSSIFVANPNPGFGGSPTFGGGTGFSGSPTFGTVTSALDPRILQLAMKFSF